MPSRPPIGRFTTLKECSGNDTCRTFEMIAFTRWRSITHVPPDYRNGSRFYRHPEWRLNDHPALVVTINSSCTSRLRPTLTIWIYCCERSENKQRAKDILLIAGWQRLGLARLHSRVDYIWQNSGKVTTAVQTGGQNDSFYIWALLLCFKVSQDLLLGFTKEDFT